MKISSTIALGTVLGFALGAISAAQAAPDRLASEEIDQNQETVMASAPASGPRRAVAPPTPSRHDLEVLDEDVPYAASLSAARGTGNIIRVGSDTLECDYNNLFDAISNASDGDTIYLQSTTALYLGSGYNIHNKSLNIRGGFESCIDNSPSGRTTLDANGSRRVFDIWLSPSNSSQMSVTLENLVITGGSTSGGFGGGGVLIDGRQGGLFVSLVNVLVTENETTADRDGGGVRVLVNGDREGDGLMLTMDNDSEILSNSASGDGGGLACINSGFSTSGLMIRLGAINLADNSATNGGGMAINGCSQVIYYSGGPVFLIIPTGAMFANTATGNGGGIFVENGGRAFIYGNAAAGFGDSAHAAHMVANNAANGGAAYVTGENSRLRLNDAVVAGNAATGNGGGIFAGDQSSFLMSRPASWNGACQPSESSGGLASVPRCSRARNNSAGERGGAFFSDNGAEVVVERTIMTNNQSDLFGSIMVARSDVDSGLTATIELADSLAYDNQGNTLFYAWTNSDITMRGSTVTDNNAGNHVFRAFTSQSARVRITNSIIWDPDRTNVMSQGGTGTFNLTNDCLIGHQDAGDTGFSSTSFYSNINPQLIEHEDKPYHPAPTSPAIDYCDGFSVPEDGTDLTNTLRGTAHQGPPTIEPPNSVPGGTFDLGAYETQWEELPDEIFQDRFE